jgi:hypothetical protein
MGKKKDAEPVVREIRRTKEALTNGILLFP